MSRSEKYRTPVVHKEISVNINDWMTSRQQVFNPNGPAQAGVVRETMTTEELIFEAEKRQEAWLESERMSRLADKLEASAVECSECGQTERPYKEDYLCYKCRDKLDA